MRLFPEGFPFSRFRLADSRVLATGSIVSARTGGLPRALGELPSSALMGPLEAAEVVPLAQACAMVPSSPKDDTISAQNVLP